MINKHITDAILGMKYRCAHLLANKIAAQSVQAEHGNSRGIVAKEDSSATHTNARLHRMMLCQRDCAANKTYSWKSTIEAGWPRHNNTYSSEHVLPIRINT